jgi:uncharacterized membrane protein YphA (DoxX/SURF4 family)
MSRKKKKAPASAGEPVWLMIVRIVLGLVFIFSASMKGVDPLGTAYRVQDYLGAYSMEWLNPYSLAISIFLITVEFLLGVALLLRLKAKLAALGMLLIMIFFTVVTYFDARYNLVPDCGCFGDAVKLSNWGTFYKNIALIVLALIVFIKRRSLVVKMAGWAQYVVLFIITGGFVWFIFYNYNHLPMLDFRDWKVGRDMKTENEDAAKTYLVYKNIETGELAEYTSENLPWKDTVWRKQWEFVDQRYDDSEVLKKHHLIIESANGNDFTTAILENPDYQLLLISYDVETASSEGMLKFSSLIETVLNQGVSVALLTATDPETLQKYFEVYSMRYPVFFSDDIELKAMIRSNPGLVLMKDGFVLNKWHYNDFPENWKDARLESVD